MLKQNILTVNVISETKNKKKNRRGDHQGPKQSMINVIVQNKSLKPEVSHSQMTQYKQHVILPIGFLDPKFFLS